MFAPPDPRPPRGGEAHPALSASTVGAGDLEFRTYRVSVSGVANMSKRSSAAQRLLDDLDKELAQTSQQRTIAWRISASSSSSTMDPCGFVAGIRVVRPSMD